jgi:hypothetical protein
MTTPAPILTMAVPDAEFVEIVRRVATAGRRDHITLLSQQKEHIKFYKTKSDKIKAIRMIDGKPVKFLVEPLSKLIPNEREYLKKQIHDKNPEYNNARLEYEVDMIYEMRESVKKIVAETGCKPEDALRALEYGLAGQQANEKMGQAAALAQTSNTETATATEESATAE